LLNLVLAEADRIKVLKSSTKLFRKTEEYVQ
jgi:hypothetical protein